MKDSPEFNIHFVSIIERYPLIYDYNCDEYSNRNLQDKAWEKISKEVQECVQDCKERWKNLRGSYTRHLKYVKTLSGSGGRKKKPYYLAEYMTFLLPFTKSRGTRSNTVTPPPMADTDNSYSELDNNDALSIAQYEEGLKNEYHFLFSPSSNSSHNPDSSAPASEVTHTSTSAKVLKKSRVNLNNEPNYEDPDVLFLLSLLPDLKKMNDNQKRRYKIEMLMIAGKILGETS